MLITVNGMQKALETPLTIAALLDTLAIEQKLVVVEHNGAILDRTLFATLKVAEGDSIEIVRFVGGG